MKWVIQEINMAICYMEGFCRHLGGKTLYTVHFMETPYQESSELLHVIGASAAILCGQRP